MARLVQNQGEGEAKAKSFKVCATEYLEGHRGAWKNREKRRFAKLFD